MSNSFSAVPLPQSFEPFTNLPTGEGSKKSEPDKFDQIMMLQKAFKISKDVYHEAFPDLKFMESKLSSLPMMGFSALHPGDPKVSGDQNSITMMKNSGKLFQMMFPHHSSNFGSSTGTSKAASSYLGPNFHNTVAHKQLASKLYGVSGTSVNNKGTTTGPSTLDGSSELLSGALLAGMACDNSPQTGGSCNINAPASSRTNTSMDGLKLLLSPWQQMMFVPPQQALVIERMHSGARRFVVLDFGAPILLTDMVIPSCFELASLSVDIWLHREEKDGQRLVVASDIGMRSLIICDLQPPPVCRYLKVLMQFLMFIEKF